MKVYYNDNEKWCCDLLEARVKDGQLPDGFVDRRSICDVQIKDLTEYRQIHLFAGIGGFPLGFKWAGVPSDFSVITGGFPCQDISNAGKQAGITGERSGLWKEMLRIIRGVRPDFAVMENVSALLARGLDTVLGDLAEIGYDAEWHCISPSRIGIPTNRDRVWICAYTKSVNVEKMVDKKRLSPKLGRMGGEDIPRTGWTVDRSRMGRGIDGIPCEMDRFRGLGNAIVPQIAQLIGAELVRVDQEVQP